MASRQRDDNRTRILLAQQCARIMDEEGVKDFLAAKRKAATRMRISNKALLPNNVEIEQALVNLLDNAIRFSPPDGEITLTAGYADNRLEILLCDEGPGIPADQREKIFDMFYTVRQGDRGHRQGTGLGLAIVRGMIGAHGGTVTAHAGTNGQGTGMQILLTVAPPENSAA